MRHQLARQMRHRDMLRCIGFTSFGWVSRRVKTPDRRIGAVVELWPAREAHGSDGPNLHRVDDPVRSQPSDAMGAAQQEVPVSKVRMFQPSTVVTLVTLKSCSTVSRCGSMYAFDHGA